jgi:hypothetical protein
VISALTRSGAHTEEALCSCPCFSAIQDNITSYS